MTFGSTFGRVFSPTFQTSSQAAASAAAFVPTDISGCVTWIDFSDANYLFTDAGTTKVSADGDAIYQANDKSGNSANAVQSSATLRPLYKTNIQNGKSTGYFDGSDDSMVLTNLTLTNYTVFNVIKFLTSAVAAPIAYGWDTYPASPRNALLYVVKHTDGYFAYSYAVNSTETFTTTNIALTNDSPYLIDSVRNGASINTKLNANALTDVTSGTGSFTQVGHRFATHYYSGANKGQNFKGYICELLIYNSALSSGDQASVRTYLNNKWAIYS